MKNLKYLFGLMLVWILASCTEGTDFDMEYTPLAPVGGHYVVTVSYGVDATKTDAQFWANPKDVKEVGMMYMFLSNTTNFDKDKAWVRVGSYSANQTYSLNAKISIDMNTFKFSGDGVDNFPGNSATAVDKATVNGFCTHNEFKAPSGATTDHISFTYSRTASPGYHYKVEGWKFTGWEEDDL